MMFTICIKLCIFVLTDTTTSATSPSIMKKEVDTLQSGFNGLAGKAFEYFNSNPIKIRAFKGKVANMSVTLRVSMFTLFEECFNGIDPQSQIADSWIKLCSLWDFLNYELLEHVIETFIHNSSIKLDLQQYTEAIDRFCSSTKVHEFVQAWPFRMKKPTEAKIKNMVAKTDRTWEQCTLQDIKETANSITQLFSIPRPFLLLRNVEEGCVSILWYIPPTVANHVESLQIEPDSMTNHKLLSITIDNVQIYPLTSTRQVSLHFKSFYTATQSTENSNHLHPFTLALINGKDDLSREQSPATFATLGYLPDGSSARLVLIEGTALVDNSAFSLRACVKWANKEVLDHIALLIFLPLVDARVRNIKNLRDLVALVVPENMSLEEELKANNGQGIGFWLVACDEILASSDNQSFFKKLVSSEILPEAVVIVSTQTFASDYIKEQLDKHPSQHIKIVPSIHDQIDWLIDLKKLAPTKFSNLVDQFLKYLKETPIVESNIHTPLATCVTLAVYQWSQRSGADLQTSITVLYYTYTCFFVPDSKPRLDSMQWETNHYAVVSYLCNRLQEFLAEPAFAYLSEKEKSVIIEKCEQYGFFTEVLRLSTQIKSFKQEMTRMLDTEEAKEQLSVFDSLFSIDYADIIPEILCAGREIMVRSDDSWSSNDYVKTSYCIARSNCTWGIHCSNANMGDEKMVIFLEELIRCDDVERGNGYIISLDFSGNSITSKGLECLSDIPSSFLYHLKSLDVSHNNLDSTAVDHIAETIIHTPQLERLTLRANNAIQEGDTVYLISAVGNQKALKSLDLASTNIGEEDCNQLAQLISSSQCLEQLDVGHNNLSSDSLRILFRGMQKNNCLKYLRLPGNILGDSEAAMLLAENTSIIEVDLHDCSISTIGGVALALSLMTNSTLETLNISNNLLGEEAIYKFSELLLHNKTLKMLEMNNSLLTQPNADMLVESLSNNMTLEQLTLPQTNEMNTDIRVKWVCM